MRISRFTPAATQIINFIAGDVGRPLEHVVSNFVVYGKPSSLLVVAFDLTDGVEPRR